VLAELYREFPKISLRRFAEVLDVAHWRLRDFIAQEKARVSRERKERELRAQVKRMALKHPTFGHRFIHQELIDVGIQVGRHKVRQIMKALGLLLEKVKKPRRKAPAVTPEVNYPPGRRVQIDATQVQLDASKAWVYIVQDVTSRACLAIEAVRSLSQYSAREVLTEAISRLRELGIHDSILIQSDGGSDFTSEVFQQYCATNGQWIRCRVNQRGGTGIIERLNQTFKYSFLFREEYTTLDQLRDVCRRFENWYNYIRKHSSVNYKTPWQALKVPDIPVSQGTYAGTASHPKPRTADETAHSLGNDSSGTDLTLKGVFGAPFSPESTPSKTLRNKSCLRSVRATRPSEQFGLQ
jgi:transposase InsO family protein